MERLASLRLSGDGGSGRAPAAAKALSRLSSTGGAASAGGPHSPGAAKQADADSVRRAVGYAVLSIEGTKKIALALPLADDDALPLSLLGAEG